MKPIYKKWWVWVIAFFVVLTVYGAITGVNQAKEQIAEEKNNPVEEKEETKAESDKKDDEEEQKVNAEEIEEEDPENEDIKSSELFDGELTMTYEPETLWSENSFFRVVYKSFEDVEQAFKDEEVNSVLVMINALMTDEKGNEDLKSVITYRYTRDDFDELNYDNFIDMAVAEEWRILNEAESYFIHPGIRKNLKDKYIQNLN